jgi:hypothetical protein
MEGRKVNSKESKGRDERKIETVKQKRIEATKQQTSAAICIFPRTVLSGNLKETESESKSES